jgi:transposase
MKALKTEVEVEKARLIAGAIEGKYTNREVSARLRVTIRHVKRMKARYRIEGSDSVVHGNSGRHPANYTKDDMRQRIVTLKQSADYRNTNFTHFRELLAEREHIKIGYSALLGIMKQAGIVSKKTHRASAVRFSHREPRPLSGELLQTDATAYDWFDIGQRFALHGFQDDATGKITGLYMCENECLMGYLGAFRQTLTNYGVPVAIYADRIGVYFVNTKKKENWTVEEQLAGRCFDKTQFGHIADELGCELIPAGSPQAKGRIERLWQTLQDRLFVWFGHRKIKTIEAANAVLPEFVLEFNEHFGHDARISNQSAFDPLPPQYDLDTLLAAKYERTTDACSAFSFQNYTFQIESPKPIIRKKILFVFSEKIGFKVRYGKQYYPVKFLGFSGKKRFSHLPDVTKQLLKTCFYKNVKGDDHILN